MKKLILCAAGCLLAMTSLHAEDVLQIVPQQVVPGNTMDDDNYFTIEMNNEQSFVALQFDLWLPKGMSIELGSFEMNGDRLPWTGRASNKKFYHTLVCSEQPQEGHYRIECYSTDVSNNVINGNSGALFDIYYNADINMATGILPVRITGVVMAIDGNHDVKPADGVSFFYTPDVDFAALTSIDLTAAGGVATQDVATAARSLMENPNSLLCLNDGSAAEGRANVVVGERCARLALTDDYAFRSPKAFSADEALYTRCIAADGWHSLCLPFRPDTSAGMKVGRFAGLDASGSTVYFDEGEIEAGMPCIFRANAGSMTLRGTDCAIAATPEALDDDCMSGTYTGMGAGTLEGCYALRPDGTGFGRCSATAYARPFRAVVRAGGSKAKVLQMVINGEATGMTMTGAENVTPSVAFTPAGIRIAQPTHGLCIVNGKKVAVKRHH